MPIWKAKTKPVPRWSRLIHLLLGSLATAYGGHFGGYGGSVGAGVGVILGGLGWELSNRIRGKGPHPYADALDFWAFVLGAAAAGITYAVAFPGSQIP